MQQLILKNKEIEDYLNKVIEKDTLFNLVNLKKLDKISNTLNPLYKYFYNMLKYSISETYYRCYFCEIDKDIKTDTSVKYNRLPNSDEINILPYTLLDSNIFSKQRYLINNPDYTTKQYSNYFKSIESYKIENNFIKFLEIDFSKFNDDNKIIDLYNFKSIKQLELKINNNTKNIINLPNSNIDTFILYIDSINNDTTVTLNGDINYIKIYIDKKIKNINLLNIIKKQYNNIKTYINTSYSNYNKINNLYESETNNKLIYYHG